MRLRSTWRRFVRYVNFPLPGIHKFFHRNKRTRNCYKTFQTSAKRRPDLGLLCWKCGLRYLAGGLVAGVCVAGGFGWVAAGFGAAVGVGAAGGGGATPEAVL